MTKLNLAALRVDTFATTNDSGSARGTVLGQELARQSLPGCPASFGGTCYITCAGCTGAACA
jgi:hypothetical protein